MISVNGIQINPTLFPDNTSQVWKLPDSLLSRRHVFIKWDYSHEGEVMQLAQLQDLFSHNGVNTSLEITYLPYARQDKQVRNDQTFALRTFAKLLNAMNFYKIICLDPHSSVAKELINNFEVITPLKYFEIVNDMTKPDVVCFPDKGAKEKYEGLLEFPSIYADKQRNQLTGEIEGITLIGNAHGEHVLIFDDLCDGGATFIKLSALLIDAGAHKVDLFVTHGLFSKGLRRLFNAGIGRIFTKDGEASMFNDNVVYRLYND